jgi:hypothetical protein
VIVDAGCAIAEGSKRRNARCAKAEALSPISSYGSSATDRARIVQRAVSAQHVNTVGARARTCRANDAAAQGFAIALIAMVKVTWIWTKP